MGNLRVDWWITWWKRSYIQKGQHADSSILWHQRGPHSLKPLVELTYNHLGHKNEVILKFHHWYAHNRLFQRSGHMINSLFWGLLFVCIALLWLIKEPITLYTNTDIQKKHYCSTSVVQKENSVCMYIQMNDIEIYVTRIVFNKESGGRNRVHLV